MDMQGTQGTKVVELADGGTMTVTWGSAVAEPTKSRHNGPTAQLVDLLYAAGASKRAELTRKQKLACLRECVRRFALHENGDPTVSGFQAYLAMETASELARDLADGTEYDQEECISYYDEVEADFRPLDAAEADSDRE